MTDSGAYGADMQGATTPGAHPGSGTGMLTPAQWCEHNSWQLPNGVLFSAEAAANDPGTDLLMNWQRELLGLPNVLPEAA